MSRKSLDLGSLSDFQPRRPEEPQKEPVELDYPKPPQAWQSREPIEDGQINIRAPSDTIKRFKKLCKEDRRTYSDMLNILMDSFQNPTGK